MGMRLRTLLIIGYSAVLTLAALGLGLGLITVLGLASTSEVMVRENFRALELASRLRELNSSQQLAVISRLAETEGSTAALIPPYQREANELLEQARAIAGSDDELSLIDAVQESVDRLAHSMSTLASGVNAGQSSGGGAEQGFDKETASRDSIVAAFAAVSTATRAYYRHHHEQMQIGGLAIQQQSYRLLHRADRRAGVAAAGETPERADGAPGRSRTATGGARLQRANRPQRPVRNRPRRGALREHGRRPCALPRHRSGPDPGRTPAPGSRDFRDR